MKKSIGLLTPLLIIIFWVSHHYFSDATFSDMPISVPTTLNDQQQTKTTRQNPNLLQIPSLRQKPESVANPHTNNALETSLCTTHQQLNSDPRQQAAQQWMEDSFGVDVATIANIYAYSTEADLLEAASNGDSTAMLALGMNYRWFALHNTFQSPRLRPKDLPEVVYTEKPLDKTIMEKSRYWLMQAALNNQLSGLTELAYSYVDEANDIDDMEEKQTLGINGFAYLTLVDSMQPIAERTMPTDFSYTTDKEKLTLLKNRQAEIMNQWREDRRKLGLNESLELNPSKDVTDFLELQRNLCRDT